MFHIRLNPYTIKGYKMDKQTLVQKPFTKQGRKELKEGRKLDIGRVDNVEKKILKEKDAWDKLGYS